MLMMMKIGIILVIGRINKEWLQWHEDILDKNAFQSMINPIQQSFLHYLRGIDLNSDNLPWIKYKQMIEVTWKSIVIT